jgi:ribosomal protein S18 acetylase RimI-like enzyme
VRRVRHPRSAKELANLIARLHVESWRRVYRGFYPDRYLDVEAIHERRRFWRHRLPELREVEGEVFLARVADEAAGFACVEPGPRGGNRAYIDNLHVLPAFQGLGIGKALVDECADWAARRSFRQLYLYVFETNQRALAFYRATGWHVAGREMHALVTEGEAPVLRMVKTLSPRPTPRHT